MRRLLIITFTFCLHLSLVAQVVTGPYAPPAGQPGSTAIHKDSSAIVGWANEADIERGWVDISDTTQGKTTAGNDTSATDKAGVNGVVSLGDSGIATLTFNGLVYDGVGADFAVYENAFGTFLELAFVEVSSDGINFYRFDAVSLTDTSNQTGSFDSTDATNLYNFAGKYRASYGVPFDLNELSGTPGLDVNAISHIRVVDVVGNINNPYASYDSEGNPVNDPWPTPFATGGFDLDAVGVIHLTPSSLNDKVVNSVLNVYPNPVQEELYIHYNTSELVEIKLFDIEGKVMLHNLSNQQQNKLSLDDFKQGLYFVQVISEGKVFTKKIIKQ